MNLSELIVECRRASRDTVVPYFWKDEVWIAALNEAQDEACVRARLIEDDEADFCWIDLEPGTQRYQIDSRIIKVIEARNSEGQLISGYEIGQNALTLGIAPTVAQTIRLLVYRRPLNKLVNDDDRPEIDEPLHRYLTHWALHRYYSDQDADTFDANAAAKHEAAFELRFGKRPSASVERKQRRKRARVTRFNPGF